MIKLPVGHVHSIECAATKANEKQQKARERQLLKAKQTEKKKHAKRKREFYVNDIKTRASAAKAACHLYINARDAGEPCLSCKGVVNFNSYIGGSGVNAGHYKSRGAHPALRFNELNIHVQCYRCNVKLSGNIENYRINLIEKIGLDKVEWLEGPHKPKKYTCAELKEIELMYKSKLKLLQ